MSGVSKPSGIKPPSKVTKPSLAAVNGNETENGTDSRRASEDMGKKKLPVLARKVSVTEHGVDDDTVGDLPKQHDRKISEVSRKLSDGSIDTAWEQARRLSEAGVRRMSDASVLTVDTDSFIVGDRVFVNGVKPGYIQYIGEAKFAPGEWAGIVLDDTSGKNNGSVGGVRYFQCQPLRGIFSRLTRLTRFPLEGAEMPSDTASEAPTSSPTPSKVDAPSKASSPAPSLPLPSDLKLGQRVIVNSSLGSKAGVLRYVGGTDFAAGNWAGVELDDPVGKNDGTVGGKRYFECRANHGLFAPVHKVSLSPANAMRRVSSSATPNRPGLTRQGTRDSMGSISVSSMASTTASRVRLGVQSLTTPNKRPSRPSPPAGTASALQELLREKEKQIEQLLKEREFERAALVRAAAQTEEAEKRVIESNKKLSQLEDEANGEVQRLQLLLTKGEEERKRTAAQWEEDRRRLEDLQFQLEEATIIKSDAEGRNGELENRIRELEKSLKDELTKNEELEKEANRGFELEEQLVTLKEEKDTLLLEIKRFKDGLVSADSELKQELVNIKEKLIALEEALAEKEKCVQLEKEEKEKWHAVVKQVEEKNDELNEQILELNDLVKTKDQALQAKHQELEMAKLDTKHVKETADKEERQLDELSANIVKQEAEIQQLNHTIQALNQDKLDWLRKYEGLESCMKQITHDKDETRHKLEMKNQELEVLKQNLSDLQKALEGNSEEQTKMLDKLKNSQEMERELVLINQEVDNLKRLLSAEKESAASILQEKTGEISKLREKLSESEMELGKKTELEQQLKDALQESVGLRTRLAEIETIHSTEAKDSQSKVFKLNEVLQEREEQARKTLEANQAKLQKLERVCEESEFNLKELKVKYETMEAEAKKVLSSKEESDKEVTKLAEELRQIQTQLRESQAQYDKLKADLTEKTTQASHEVAEQRNQVARLEEDLANVRLSNADLQQTLQTVQNQRDALEKERTLSNDAVKERDAKLVQVTLEVERLKTTFDTHRAELQKKLEQTLKEAEMAEELRIALEKTRARGEEMEALAHERETELFELQEQKRAFVEELERLSQYESEREIYRQQLLQKDQEISLLSKDYAKQQAELSSFNARYEKDKRVWEQKVVDFQIKKQISLQEVQSHDPQMSQLLEEKEASKREIAFLNSVIVDMQRKLDEGKLQLEISHASLMNQGISEVVQKNGVAKRLVAPRLFCDICDTFDLHDTEDCPKQSSFDESNDLPTPPHSQHQGKRNEPRPYCNTCEAFGHLTSECAEEDTY